MKTETALKVYRTRRAIAQLLGITPSAVTQWGDTIPETSAYKLQVLSGGRVRVDPSVYRRARGSV
jgi:DNA-binding transcriptional regulator YdaS (Cro superfamily)